jgi:uncharacterized protein YegL
MPDESTTTSDSKPSISVRMPATFKKSLPYFWICDCSESMGLKNRSNNLVKMDEINKAIPQAIENIRIFAEKSKKSRITMRTIKFSDTAEWMDKDSIPVNQYTWKDLSADGITSLGAAFIKVAQALKPIEEGGTMPKTAYSPVIVLITDGYPTDDWEKGYDELMNQFWGQEAVRLAIALEGADEDILRRFIGDVPDAEMKLVRINDAELPKLAEMIKEVTIYQGMPSEKKIPVEQKLPEPAPKPEENPVNQPVPEEVNSSGENTPLSPDTAPVTPSDVPPADNEKSLDSSKKEEIPPIHEEIIF